MNTVRFRDDEEDGNKSKRARAFVISGHLFTTTPSSIRPIPLKVDNNMPAIELRFETSSTDEVRFLCHLDTCGGMNTGSLLLHQWLMTNHPSIVHKYEEYRDPDPFEPLSLDGAVPNPTSNNVSNKLTSVVTYRTQYTSNKNKPVTMSIGLGESIQVNAILGIPQIQEWGLVIDTHDHVCYSITLQRKFPIHYHVASSGLPPT